MRTRTEVATARFLSGYNCAQAVLVAFREEAHLDEDLALKLATGLGAGMGRRQEVCGAVTGGILVLGLRHGRGRTDSRTATEQTYLETRELMDRFAAKHGSCLCRQLFLGCDLVTEEGQRRFKADDLINKVCPANVCRRSDKTLRRRLKKERALLLYAPRRGCVEAVWDRDAAYGFRLAEKSSPESVVEKEGRGRRHGVAPKNRSLTADRLRWTRMPGAGG